MNNKKANIIFKLLLFLSGAAFLVITTPWNKTQIIVHLIAALLLFAAIMVSPIKYKKPASKQVYVFAAGMAIGAYICSKICWNFYMAWKPSGTVARIAQSLGVSHKLLLKSMSIAVAALAIPFIALVFVFIARIAGHIWAKVSPTLYKHRYEAFWFAAAVFASSLPIFNYGLSYGHDWNFHLMRIESIAQGISNGQIPVRMNGTIYSNYGYPVSVFYGDLLLYMPALLRVVGFTPDLAYKAYILFINVLTETIAYFCFSKMFAHKTALLAAIAYELANYRLVDIYVRTAVGEYTAMAFYPLILIALWYMYQGGDNSDAYKKAALFLAVGMTFIMYTHLLSVEIAVVVIAIVAIFEYKKTFTKNCLLAYIKAVVAVLIMGASYWLPFIDYYLSCDVVVKTWTAKPKLIQAGGTYISDYFAFFRSVRGQNAVNASDRMALTPGLVLMAAFAAAIYILLVKREKNRKLAAFALYSSIFMLLSSNIFPWDWWAQSNPVGKFMSQIQFAWRYIGVVCVILAALLGYVLDKTSTMESRKDFFIKIAAAGCFLMCFVFMSNIQEGAGLTKFARASDIPVNIASEYSLVGTSRKYLPHKVIVAKGTGEIIKERGVNKDVYVEVPAGGTVRFPAFCYPYYTVTDENGRSYDITEGRNRTIKIQLDTAYSGMLYLRYKEPWYWRAAELISLCGAAYMAYYLVRAKKHCGG